MASSKVRPLHYDLFLKPDLKALKFEGKTNIRIRLLEEIKQITLNSVKLQILSSSISVKGKEILTKVANENPEDETITLSFDEIIPSGEAELDIEFAGELNDKMKGFYRSKYFVDGETEPRYAATTQFEATDARRCFPCKILKWFS